MISLEWVNEYIDISKEDLKELAVKISTAGINVEKIITNHIDNLVIGEVLECTPHPDSDHLKVCQVKINDNEINQIICGAPNVKKGIKVIVALPNAVLPDIIIKKSKIRGIESNGMICALFEIGLEEKTEENYNKGIYVCDSDAKVGTDALKYLNQERTLYELDIHKHRNNDCFYHIGFAYEIACIINKKVTLPDCSFKTINDNVNNHLSLKVKTPKCPYYLARMVKDIEIHESPDFIKKRLIDAGMRPINNVVDISNYVMLEFGQPLHFFDKDKLGDNILVRDAKEGEEITTLDNKDRILTKDDIVITDGKKAVCIAGVMGGLNTDVDENTKNILIESAIFSPTSIRITAQHLNLKSEASLRYGKGLSYEYTEYAINRACHLLEKYAGATILSGTAIHDNIDKTPKTVTFKAIDINKILGITIDNTSIENILKRLDFPYTLDNDTFNVTIPSRRLDVDPNVNDIAEEIGRLYGYENLKSSLPILETRRGEYIGDVKIRKEISKRLRTLGLNECKNYTLVSPESVKLFDYDKRKPLNLPNAMSSDKSVLRTSLLPSLINVYNYNKARGVKDIFLYEIAKTYDQDYQEITKVGILIKGNYLANTWSNNTIKSDFYLLKGMISNLLEYLGFKNRYTFVKEKINSLHPGISASIYLDKEIIGIIGRIHPSLNKDEIYLCELNMDILYKSSIKPLKFKSASKYPEITKDVAFIVDNNIDSETIKNTIIKEGKRILIDAFVFDLYPNYQENKKSIAYKLVFGSNERTLEETEVMMIFNQIINKVTSEYKAILRDK